MENSSPEIQKFKNQIEDLQEQISDSDLEAQEKSNETLRATLTALADTIVKDISAFKKTKELSREEKGIIKIFEQELRDIRLSLGYYSEYELKIEEMPRMEKLDTAGNPKTPPETLVVLAKDEDIEVRSHAARNPKTPPETIAKLEKDNDEVRLSVVLNPKTPFGTLTILAKDKSKYVRMGAAGNPKTPPETLAVLAKDKDIYVRAQVALNPNTPPETLAVLAKDKDKGIKKIAKDKLLTRKKP